MEKQDQELAKRSKGESMKIQAEMHNEEHDSYMSKTVEEELMEDKAEIDNAESMESQFEPNMEKQDH